jgi:predicted Zn-dependent peptidase
LRIVENLRLGEKYFFINHYSGLKIYLYPKKNYSTSYAVLGVNYGSINERYKTSSGVVKTPAGTAHYLEHKLFETEESDAFLLFSKTGASANAYTSFDKTAYLFSCNSNLKESLAILIDFVQNPYFTEKGVEKERGIIAQEIKMYQDSPEWVVFVNLLESLYINHPVRTDITGSEKSISEITPEILYDCYNNFYALQNMSLCIAGNFEPKEIFEFIENRIKIDNKNKTEAIFPFEPERVANSFAFKKMEVITPVFNFGFKEPVKEKFINTRSLIISEIILCVLMLKSGAMYNRLLENELINTSDFSCEYFNGPYFASAIFSGESKDPKRTSEIILEETSNLVSKGIEANEFDRAKKSLYAETISVFDSVSSIANTMLDFSFSGRKIFDFLEILPELKLEEVNESLKNKFNSKLSALSVILPAAV